MKSAYSISAIVLTIFLFRSPAQGGTGYGLSNIFTLETRTSTAVNDNRAVPAGFEVYQNYPNPFNPTTTIRFSIPKGAHTEVHIYDVTGNHIRTLYDGYLSSGTHEFQWDGMNKYGQTVSSGTYFYQLKFGESNMVKKMQFIK